MSHKCLATVAGCIFTVALGMGGGGAWAKDVRIASLLASSEASAQSSVSEQVGRAASDDLGAGQDDPGLVTVTAGRPTAPAKGPHKAKAAKKHGPCVHGEWVNEEEYNPFTLSCTVLDD